MQHRGVAREISALTGKPLYEAFGMSELSTFISSSPSVPRKPGFIGKFGQDPAKAAAFKKRLAERIPLPEMPGKQKRKRRRGDDEDLVPLPNKVMHPAIYYVATLGVLVLLFWLIVSMTNL